MPKRYMDEQADPQIIQNETWRERGKKYFLDEMNWKEFSDNEETWLGASANSWPRVPIGFFTWKHLTNSILAANISLAGGSYINAMEYMSHQ